MVMSTRWVDHCLCVIPVVGYVAGVSMVCFVEKSLRWVDHCVCVRPVVDDVAGVSMVCSVETATRDGGAIMQHGNQMHITARAIYFVLLAIYCAGI